MTFTRCSLCSKPVLHRTKDSPRYSCIANVPENAKHVGRQYFWFQLLFSFIKSRLLLVAHHLLLPFLIFPIFMGGLKSFGGGDCLVAAGFLLEASTPFVSLRKILAILGTLSNAIPFSLVICPQLLLFRSEKVCVVHCERGCHDRGISLLSSGVFPCSLLPLLAWTW